jgi:hypothetical protein
MKRLFPSLAWVLSTFIVIAIFAHGLALGRILGNKQEIDTWLEKLVEPLHQRGIDVVPGDVARVPLGNRPRIVSLPAVSMQKPEYYARADWMQAFMAGTTGFIAGARSDTPKTRLSDEDKFHAIWAESPEDKRGGCPGRC